MAKENGNQKERMGLSERINPDKSFGMMRGLQSFSLDKVPCLGQIRDDQGHPDAMDSRIDDLQICIAP